MKMAPQEEHEEIVEEDDGLDLGLDEIADTAAAEAASPPPAQDEALKAELDELLSEREKLNTELQTIIDLHTDPWGVKVLRYEIKNINPPHDVLTAMEKQMRAEREKRAAIFESEGQRQATINVAEGTKQEAIRNSEGEKMKRINEAEGMAREIELVAVATAEGIRKIAVSIEQPGGKDAVNLRVAEQYIGEFGKLAKENNTMILPGNLTDVASMVATAMSTIKQTDTKKRSVVES